VYLAYLDDSDTKQKSAKWQVMAAVIIRDSHFRALEVTMGAVAELLMPAERLDKFTEFHASELYGGFGAFEGIDQDKRFSTMTVILGMLEKKQLPVVYGAVNLQRLNEMVYASADPLDIAFRICAEGVETWLYGNSFNHFQEQREREGFDIDKLFGDGMAILISDDCDGKSKASMQRSFRKLRRPHRGTEYEASALLHLHDDMYFGDSRYSIGIQLADLCSYFIARHLEGDATVDGFYNLIESHIVHFKVEPKEQNIQETVATH
jgi:hypothetical protein